MKNLFIFCLLIITISLKAQDKPCPCENELDEAFDAKLKGQVYQGIPGLIGEEFYNQKHANGDIYLEDGQIAYDQKIRYNGRIDGLLLLPKNSPNEIMLDKFFIKGFSFKNYIENDTLFFTKIMVIKEFSTDSTEIFGQALYQHRLSLFVHRRYIYVHDVNEHLGDKLVARKLFAPSYVYYFKLPNNRTIGFRSFRKRQLYKLFPENKELMKKLFREKHQRRFRKEEDLIRIADVLNAMYD